MSFIYPLGLLGLIGVPIVIIIYILRSKYNEQTVSSIYLWKLSEKFLKRKNPLSGLTGLISLILQILTIACISLAVAKPVIVLPDAAYDYCFILDASGSMNMKHGKNTRFGLAKEKIANVIKNAADGSTYSLVTVAGEATTVFDSVENKEAAIEALGRVSGSYETHAYADLVGAAQQRFDANTSSILYLVTDKAYEQSQNIQVLDMSGENEKNYAIFDVKYSQSGGKLYVSAEVISYNGNASLTVNLYLNDEKTAAATTTVSVVSGKKTKVELSCSITKFQSFTMKLAQSDGYEADNTVVTHNLKTDNTYKTLIVSKTGFFLESAIDAILDSEIKIVHPDKYDPNDTSYGLYIFDCYTPSVLPDATVWLINSDKSIENSGFSVRSTVDLEEAVLMEKTQSSSTAIRALLSGVDGKNLYFSKYVKYSGMYLDFSTLFSYNSNPLIFVGTNGLGNRQVVFGFDLHTSDLPLTTDFIMLMKNLLAYSFPDVIDQTNYTVGEDVIVNVLPNTDSIKAFAPSGKEVYMSSDGAYATLSLKEIGTYTITMKLAGEESVYKIYSGANPDESEPNQTGESFSLSGERTYDKRDGSYDPTMLLFICAVVLFIADWGVYCYEKYQLR